jgi:hypothetical protein
MPSQPLLEYVRATANSSGVAEASIGPARYGDSWEISLINTTTNSTSESKLKVYRNAVADSAQVLSTYSGNNDTAGGGRDISLRSGEKLVFVWSNATVGAECTARLEGDYNSRRI